MNRNGEYPAKSSSEQDDLPEAHVVEDVRLDEPDHITVILSLFGTGFRSQGYLYYQTAFVVMVCLLLGVTSVLRFLFRKRGWF